MAAIDRFILLVRSLRRNESGIAVPTALMALIASFALASVAVMSTVNVQQGTKRDHSSKEAIAAADAGANIALLRLNRYMSSLSTTQPCIGPSGELQTPTSSPSGVLWCPWTSSEAVGGATYKYAISAYPEGGAINVVAVGSSGTVSRRVNVALKRLSGKKVFADEKLIGQDQISLEGGPIIETDIGTNGSILTSGGPKICGDDRHGIGQTAPTPTGPPTCPEQGEVTEGNKNLPEIVPPTNIATENDNCRLAQNCTGLKAGQVDTYSKKTSKTDPWDAEHRAINVASSQTLTMGGSNYWVCEVNIQGKLYMPVQAHVEIYVDTPAHCGLKSGAQQVNIGAGAVIESSAYNPAQGLYEVPHIYVLGNGAVKLVGTPGSTNEVVIYAPLSEIDVGGNATWNGMLAGKTLKIHGNPVIKSDPNIKEPEITFASTFQRTRYVECIGATAASPNDSC
jgi:hypothetical protein